MKRLLLLLSVLVLVGGVGALSVSFDNAADLNYVDVITTTGTLSWVSTTGVNNYVTVNSGSHGYWSGATFIINKDPIVMTYAAATLLTSPYWEAPIDIRLYDANKNILYSFGSTSAFAAGKRVEVKMSGGTAYIYQNGIELAHSGVLALNPSYIGFGLGSAYYSGGGHSFDDIIWGSDNRYIFDAPQSGYYIKKDMITPAASGLYSPSNMLVNSNDMFARYGRGSAGIPPDPLVSENVVLEDYNTQIVYATHYRHKLFRTV
jgi:hypothetical protein